MLNIDKATTQREFGVLVGVSQPAVSAMVRDGTLSAEATLGQWLQQYCSHLREVAAGRAATGGVDLATARALQAVQQTEESRQRTIKLEIANAVTRGEYAPISLLTEVLATASQAVSERFEQLPGTLKRYCPTLPSAARDKVMSTIADARNAWVEATVELITKSLEEDDDDEPADDA